MIILAKSIILVVAIAVVKARCLVLEGDNKWKIWSFITKLFLKSFFKKRMTQHTTVVEIWPMAQSHGLKFISVDDCNLYI